MSADPTPTANEPEPARPDLHVVRNPDPDTADTAAAEVEVPPETPAETTGPVPVVDADGEPVTGKAPWDVRARHGLLTTVRGLPLLSEAPASLRESLEYSQTGDWAVSDNGGKRVVHGIATVIAYVATYPLVDLPARFRSKPIGFVLALALLITVLNLV